MDIIDTLVVGAGVIGLASEGRRASARTSSGSTGPITK